jgi:hypothetical protein
VLTGVPGDAAAEWVRVDHCPMAVETTEQLEFVETFRR